MDQSKTDKPFISLPSKKIPVTVLLIDDQAIVAEAIRRMLAGEEDIVFHYCNDPSKAIEMANEVKPTVILQDLVMPDIDGLMLVRYFRANPSTHFVPLIVLSTKEEPKIKSDAFALGASDYMVKLPDKLELLARIRYHSRGYISFLERNEAYEKLSESQQKLNAELKEAAQYVMSLLPAPLDGQVTASWRYIPSTSLGGDSFGYHWLDKDSFAVYLLDVCGHGVGAALLSISVINVLRTQSLANTDFHDPSSVLAALNEAFPMEKHNNMFFTIWYGVFHRKTRELSYASGGHPPAVLFSGSSQEDAIPMKLKTPGLVIGGMSGTQFATGRCPIDAYNKLYVFSDGVYELDKPDGTMMKLDEFIDSLPTNSKSGDADVQRILDHAHEICGHATFLDDFSIVEITFK